tara:strand:- start:1423 stop:1647 length:225 start_codon:yes stop_codon:yes gene_type:complete
MKDNYVAGDAVGTYSQDLAHIKSAIVDLTTIVSEIKAMLGVPTEKESNVNQMSLDLDLPNVTTSYSSYKHGEQG